MSFAVGGCRDGRVVLRDSTVMAGRPFSIHLFCGEDRASMLNGGLVGRKVEVEDTTSVLFTGGLSDRFLIPSSASTKMANYVIDQSRTVAFWSGVSYPAHRNLGNIRMDKARQCVSIS